jgi:hypothetical protein
VTGEIHINGGNGGNGGPVKRPQGRCWKPLEKNGDLTYEKYLKNTFVDWFSYRELD